MMMPANYSAVAENEMTYVIGGGVLEWVGDRTAPVWDASNVKAFNTNVITLIGNAFSGKMLQRTVGYVFSGNASWKGIGANLKSLIVADNGNIGDSVANTIGTLAAVYNLGRTSVPVVTGNAFFGTVKLDGNVLKTQDINYKLDLGE